MKNYQVVLATLALTSATLLFSCSKSATDDLHDAQLCLNKATSSTALGCVDKISGDSSPIAYSLRCSAIFISEGFGDAASFVNVLDNINGGSGSCTGGCSSTVSTLGSLKFVGGGISTVQERQANIDAAAEAFTQCSQADAKIYTQIASLFQLGTLTSMEAINLGAGATPTEDQLKSALTSGSLPASVIGTLVVVTSQNTCADTENASDSTKAYCAQLQAAIASGSSVTAIGQCLIDTLSHPPGYVCP